jgi:hypothetical protein
MMIAAYQFAPFFRVKLSRNFSRANEITEQHRQMTALTAARDSSGRCFHMICGGGLEHSGTAFATEFRCGLVRGAALWAGNGQGSAAVCAEFAPLTIIAVTFRTTHVPPMNDYSLSSSSSAFAFFRSAVSKPSVNQP